MKIVVTGGASGLGKSIVEKLSSEKSNTILFTYNSSSSTAQEMIEKYSNLRTIKCDFSKPDDVQKLKKELEVFNPDAIVNSAYSGKINKNYFHKLDSEEFRTGFINNLLPIIEINQLAIQLFRKKKDGRIVTILSSALVGEPLIGWSEYTAGKAYLHSLCKSWAIENAKFNITSNCISPSFMLTGLTADTDERVVEEIISSNPTKKLLTTEEVAESVDYLLNSSKQINGINLVINAAIKIH